MIHLHGKTFLTAGAVLQYRAQFQRWEYKNGTRGSIRWHQTTASEKQPSCFGIFQPDNGTSFTVADTEVKPLGRVG